MEKKSIQVVRFLKGLPASGKSRYAKSLVLEDSSFVRVNKDEIREQVFCGKWSKAKEKTVVKIESSMISAALESGKSVVVDSTNFAPKHEDRIRAIAEVYGAEFEAKLFDETPAVCIERDSKRENPVGEKVIRQMFDSFIKPSLPRQDETLSPCYIFDLDGTLAKMNGRSPYDWDKVREDLVNIPVARLAMILDSIGYDIIVMTGRDGSCIDDCVEWLSYRDIPCKDIFIRTAGDSRKDSIVKKELYEKHIKGKYTVMGWFDDRDQVVAMIRDELNLPCFQVDWGNF